MWTALTRDVSPTLGDCELSYVDRAPIDIERARHQHDAYRRALEACRCRVIALPADANFPDAVFVEDVALVLDELAIATRPGAESRRGEVASVARELARFRTLRSIEAPGTIDGGDVLRIGRTIYVGASNRSNAAAVEQLRALLGDYDYEVERVPIRGCLHLKSAVTLVAEGVVLVNPDWVDVAAFGSFQRIEVDSGEPHAANALRIGGRVIYPTAFPRTAQRLEAAGIALETVDVSELQKAEGAVTCCSIVFADPTPA
jgi:dimethylargininase